MKLTDLEKINELVDEKEIIDYKNGEIEKFLELHKEDIVVQVGDEGGYIFVDMPYIVAMLERAKKDNDARIEAVNRRLSFYWQRQCPQRKIKS